MPSLLDSPPQLPSACGWGVLYPVEEETTKPRHMFVLPAAASKKPAAAYSGGKKRNLETCTEALGCETGGVDSFDFDYGGVEAEKAERKRRTREEEEMVIEGGACRSARRRGRGPFPPPLTTLAVGTSCGVRIVHERCDRRLEVYAVRSPGVLEAERSGGRLRLRLLPLLCGASNDAPECHGRRQGAEAEKEEVVKEVDDEEEGEYGFVKYVRGGQACVDPERVAAAAARFGKPWEPEQAAAFLVATS